MFGPVLFSCIVNALAAIGLKLPREGAGPWRWLLPLPGIEGDGILGQPYDRAVDTLANTATLMAAVIAVTYLFAGLYMYRMRSVIFGFLVSAHLFWFGTFAMYLVAVGDKYYSLRLDWITSLVVVWWTAGGLTAVIFYEGALPLPRRTIGYRLRPWQLSNDWKLREAGLRQAAAELKSYVIRSARLHQLPDRVLP